MVIEEKVVRYAAPTLVGCKVANLMNLPKNICKTEDLQYCRKCLSLSGLDIQVLLERDCCRLIYLYRYSALQKILKQQKVQDFLATYGYSDFSVSAALYRLSDQLATKRDFPHEIGIFLGYPLADVQGFILHQGKNAKLSGCWKVYDNEEEALRTFSLYSDCRNQLCVKFQQGASLAELSIVG